MIDDQFAGGRAAPSGLSCKLRRRTAPLLMAIAFIGHGAWASDRFEIVNGDLLDQSTGLLWQHTSATALDAFPSDPSLPNGWHIPTVNEVLDVFSNPYAADEMTVSQNSDAFTALSFFTTSPGTNPFCSVLPAGGTCISAFAVDGPGYDAVIFEYRITKTGSVIVDSTGTLGDYTQDQCGNFCGQQTYFTVQSVPEPAGWALAGFGVAALLLYGAVGRRRGMRP